MSSGIFNQFSGHHPSTALRAGNRQSTRLCGHDYSQPGAYFITVCIHDRKQNLFGDVAGGKIFENDCGNIVRVCWNDLCAHYQNVRLDEFVVMPNHFHGIIVICDSVGARLSRPISRNPQLDTNATPYEISVPDVSEQGRDDRAPTEKSRKPTLGNMVAYFKYQSTKQINAIRQNGVEKIWQRNYYEHIIRDEKSYHAICKYIRNNPANWKTDSERHLHDEIDTINKLAILL